MKEFDLDNASKKMPYTVPENFFDNITEETLRKAKSLQQKRLILTRILPVSAAASVAILISFFVFNSQTNTINTANTLAFKDTVKANSASPEIITPKVTSENLYVYNNNITIDEFANMLSDEEVDDIVQSLNQTEDFYEQF